MSQAAEQAATPDARFLADREAKLARSARSRGETEGLAVTLKNEVAEQKKRQATEQAERDALRELIKRSGTSGRAGERLNLALEQVKRRRQLLAGRGAAKFAQADRMRTPFQQLRQNCIGAASAAGAYVPADEAPGR